MPASRTPAVMIVGAGPAGLAAAAELGRRGLSAVVLERGDGPGAAWAGHYDRLRLNTVRWTASLPGMRIPSSAGRWPSRDAVRAYLAAYRRRHGIVVRDGAVVTAVAPDGRGGWVAELEDDEPVRAPVAVVATGPCAIPVVPSWPGAEAFAGELLHACAYASPRPFAGRDVLVVGAGNSGAEIALDLAEGGAARVRLAVRTPPQIVPRTIAGVPSIVVAIGGRHLPPRVGDAIMSVARRTAFGDLAPYGLPRPAESISAAYARGGVVPISVPGFVEAVRRGAIEVVGPVVRFAGQRVAVGEQWIEPDAIVAATGYRTNLMNLLGDGSPALDPAALRAGGRPIPGAPGLFVLGYANPLAGNLREIRLEARRLGRAAARHLRELPSYEAFSTEPVENVLR